MKSPQQLVAMLKKAGWQYANRHWFCPAREPYQKRFWRTPFRFYQALDFDGES